MVRGIAWQPFEVVADPLPLLRPRPGQWQPQPTRPVCGYKLLPHFVGARLRPTLPKPLHLLAKIV
jgi:hypothetical protein